MAALIPDGIAKFRKNLVGVEELRADDEGFKLSFEDGETTFTDPTIVYDDIKSATRKYLMENQSIEPTCANTYADRVIIPVDVAMGDDLALNGELHLGSDGYIITYPVEHGNLINMVALKSMKASNGIRRIG